MSVESGQIAAAVEVRHEVDLPDEKNEETEEV